MNKATRANALFRPLILLSVFATFLLLFGGWDLARRMNADAKQHEQQLVANGFANKIIEVDKGIVPQTVWDESLANLEARNLAWAQNNIGQYLYDTSFFQYSFVLDKDDRLFFAADTGEMTALSLYENFAPAMHKAIRDIRDRERARRSKGFMLGSLKEPVQYHNLLRLNGKVFIVVASLVEPDFGTVRQKYPTAPIVVAATEVNDQFLQQFGRRYMLPDLHLRQVQVDDTRDVAEVDLNDDRGQYVATLTWTPVRPGTELALKLLPPTLVTIALFFVVTALFHRRSWRAVQELIASEARASHLAYHDPLTGLPNRVMFFDRLGVALDQLRRNGTPVAVHCLDLDRFKDVNDTFGHQIGDELIVAASKRIAEVCRRSDTFARLSGDEFAIVQLDATPHAAARLAERIVDAISQPMDLSSGRIHVSCSIGVNLLIEGEVSAADALRHADLALYRSKNNGRAQYSFFEPEMDAAMRMRREIETELREALYDGDLHMVYQPQADKHGRIAGVEALLRWHHPTRGDISPAMFIPIAEECGLINEVGMYTLREVFLASRKWDGLKVAVNISAAQLRMRDFPEKVAELLKECAVDPRTFELEITEGLLLGDDPVTHGVLKELRQMGFSIALDDFGTGYSSLSYLQRYPIDKIKIDRSFIANLGIERESVAVVQAIVKLARALRLDVIAEGVETTEQRDQLIDIGCEEIQGYLYSRPVDSARIDEMFRGRADASLQTA
ncbi:MAG: EAL domain-containing protein [Sphingobium sp.]|jgi:diguanylate cyclase (GGDEF)-like protein|nr:EAL domain-containing protein [Sphingobium sp.]MCI1272241.1 EAL domain-containing protein [Sphingobium sp.]MCI1757437.1 EAL domain-containing protein [Sphingobium sp.]MCI2054080.1 EAL domain-containing protein [Sphingobium sp.]